MSKQRCQELYKIIQDAEKELADIRSNCQHEISHEGNYMSRPGSIQTGYICDDCGSFLGELMTAKQWAINRKHTMIIPSLGGKIITDYLLSFDFDDKKISWTQFVVLTDYINIEKNALNWLKSKNRETQINNIINDETKKDNN